VSAAESDGSRVRSETPLGRVGCVGPLASEMMSSMSDQWSCSHFSISNARNDSTSNLLELLRRIAAEIERREISPMDILDVTIASEITGDGPWWSGSVYWSADSAEAT
jgi:hypothetical protein